MNEAETRAELIDPKLKDCGWGTTPETKVLREHHITAGKIQNGGRRGKKEIADYILVYKGIKLAVIEAKSNDLAVGEGVMQAKKYAKKLFLDTAYSTNGKDIYQICMKTGKEGLVTEFLSPQQLWEKTYPSQSSQTPADPSSFAFIHPTFPNHSTATWRESFAKIPYEEKGGTWKLRYYQEIAVQNVLEAIAQGKNRILLTLATGTGKTAIAFQIAWKLFHSRWNLGSRSQTSATLSRRPRILFLADRNILADQAYNSFSAFPEDALVRIKPDEIRKKGRVPTHGNLFFTIFQTFMSGSSGESEPENVVSPESPASYFGNYPSDYFDLIIIDECHRGGANDESSWRSILEYFHSAVQLGLTATPKRKDNIDTYQYFGDPVYSYSLKDGINDGFLTPFKVKRITTTLDEYSYAPDDIVTEGEIETGKIYTEDDFNRNIEIKEREEKRILLFLGECNQKEKALIFCANQAHAALIRDLVNQHVTRKDPFYCVRVTANDGEDGEHFLREFQDNEKTIPTILTTSHKLSTGVDARNIRNIVLLRPVNSMIEFKQIVGRGTRLFDGKDFFTLYDFVDAYKHFSDPEWDGEPIDEVPTNTVNEPRTPYTAEGEVEPQAEPAPKQKIIITLADGKALQIQATIATSFWSADGKPITAKQYILNLWGELPKLFRDEAELRQIWSNPNTRVALLSKLEAVGFPKSELVTLQGFMDLEKSDLYDVLAYIFNGTENRITRQQRATLAKSAYSAMQTDRQQEFIEFVLSKYVTDGVDELALSKLPALLKNKYQSLEDAKKLLGDTKIIQNLFVDLQKHLYYVNIES